MLETFIIFVVIGGFLGAGSDLWKKRRKLTVSPFWFQVVVVVFLLALVGHDG